MAIRNDLGIDGQVPMSVDTAYDGILPAAAPAAGDVTLVAQAEASIPPATITIELEDGNIARLPADTDITNVRANGADLEFVQPDGTVIVITGGSISNLVLFIGDVQIPAEAVELMFSSAGIEPAAGPEGGGEPDGTGSYQDLGQQTVGGPGQQNSLLGNTDLPDTGPDATDDLGDTNLEAIVLGGIDGLIADDGLEPGNRRDGGSDSAVATGQIQVNETGVSFALGLPSGEFTSEGREITWSFGPGTNHVIGTVPGSEGGVVVVVDATLNPTTGEWRVEILAPLDHVAPGQEEALAFQFPVVVTDSGGLPTDTTLTITVEDDHPWLNSDEELETELPGDRAENGVVDEDGLEDGNEGGDGDVAGEDTSTSGSLNILWGADRADVDDNEGRQDGAVDGSTDNADLTGRAVYFSDANVGITFDTEEGGGEQEGPQLLALPTLTSRGETVEFRLDESGTKLIGFVPGLEGEGEQQGTAERIVFEVTLSDDNSGEYTFTLRDVLDHPLDYTEDDITLTFNFTARDYDGDTRSGDFTVVVDDDTPVITPPAPLGQNLIDNGDFGGEGWNTESWGWSATDPAGWDVNGPQLERVNSGYDGAVSSTGGYIVDLEATPGNVGISQQVDGLQDGMSYQLSFEIGESAGRDGTVEVVWNGQVIGTYEPQSGQMQLIQLTVTGGAYDGTDTLTFREIGSAGDNSGTFLANVKLVQAATAFVDEDDLDNGNTKGVGDHAPGDNAGGALNGNAFVSGNLGIDFGADNTDAGDDLDVQDAPSVNNISVTFTNDTVGVNGVTELTSGGLQVEYRLSADDTVLTGYVTKPNPNGEGTIEHTVFEITLNDEGSGSFDFTLFDKLDHAPGQDENDLGLTFNYTAKDSDGDTAQGSIVIGIDDDKPVITPPVASTGESLLLNGDFSGGTWANDWWGGAAQPGNVPGWTISAAAYAEGASGPLSFEKQADGFAGLNASNGAGMIDMGGSPGNYALQSDAMTGLVAGQTYVLEFEAGAPYPETALLQVYWGDQLIATVDSTVSEGDLEKLSFQVTGNSDPSKNFIRFVEVGSGNAPIDESGMQGGGHHGTYIANVSLKQQAIAFVDEDDLDNDNTKGVGDTTAVGDNAGLAADGNAVVSGVLGINFGADNKDNGTGDVQDTPSANNISVTFTDTDVTIDGVEDLTSNDLDVKFRLSDDRTTLIGYVDRPNGQGTVEHKVFEVSLNDDDTGSFKFTLFDRLDHAEGAQENDLLLTFNYTATDSDGDTAEGSFTVGVDDDTPVLDENDWVVLEDDDLEGGVPGGIGDDEAPLNATGTLNVNYGADKGSVVLTGFAELPEGFTAQPSEDGKTLTLFQNQGGTNVAVLQVELTDDNGGYKVTQLEAVEQPDGNDENNLTFTAEYTATDGDGDSASGSLTIDIDDDSPVAHGTLLVPGVVEEEELSGGNEDTGGAGDLDFNLFGFHDIIQSQVTGLLNIEWGADDRQGTDGRTVTFTDLNDAAANIMVTDSAGDAVYDLSSGGVALTYGVSADGMTLFAWAGEDHSEANLVFKVELKDVNVPLWADGTYTFTLLKPLDQGLPGEDSLHFSFDFTATDSDGDPSSAKIQVVVIDDKPVLKQGQDGVEKTTVGEGTLEGGTGVDTTSHIQTGNFANEVNFGADGKPANALVSLSIGNTSVDVTADGQVITSAELGQPADLWQITVNLDGSWTFELLDNSLAHNKDHASASADQVTIPTITATLQDGDGDEIDVKLKVKINDDAPTYAEDADGVQNTAVGEANLDNGTGVDTTSDVQTGNFAAEVNFGADGQPTNALVSLSIGTTTVAVTGNDQIITSEQLGQPAGLWQITVDLDGAWEFKLLQNTLTHDDESASGLADQVIIPTITATLQDGDGDEIDVSLNVSINDDAPDAIDNPEGSTPITVNEGTPGDPQNLILVFDVSSSMDENDDGSNDYDSRLEFARAAAVKLIEESGATSVLIVSFANGAIAEEWMSAADAIEFIENNQFPNIPDGTDYEDALEEVQDAYNDQPKPAGETNVYFFTDGDPSSDVGTSERNDWNEFLDDNGMESYAVGFGNDVESDDSDLRDLADPNAGHVIILDSGDDEPFDDLLDTAPEGSTGTAGTSTSGNVLTDGTDDIFGADGKGNGGTGIQSITVDGAVYAYNATTGAITKDGAAFSTGSSVLSVTTALGGALTFYFTAGGGHAAGDYTYTAPADIPATTTETFAYTIVDGDGDTDTANLAIQVVAKPTVSINDVSFNEATGEVTFTISVNGPLSGPLSFQAKTADGTAKDGVGENGPGTDDYDSTTATITFPASSGSQTQTFTVGINGDNVYEGVEAFVVNLTGLDPALVDVANSDLQGTGTIVDDEAAPTVTISNASTTEGPGGNADDLVFNVTLSHASDETITLRLDPKTGTAISGTDFDGDDIIVTFAPGETSKTVRIDTEDDSIYEGSETMTLEIDEVVAGTIANPNASGTGTINDNDSAPSFSINDVSRDEDKGTITFTVTKTGSTAVESSVTWTTHEGSATQPGDYGQGGGEPLTGTLVFAAGQTSKTITINLTDDNVYESTETFTVKLTDPVNATISDGTGVGTIKDDDNAPPQAAADAFSITETEVETAGSSSRKNVGDVLDNDSDPDGDDGDMEVDSVGDFAVTNTGGLSLTTSSVSKESDEAARFKITSNHGDAYVAIEKDGDVKIWSDGGEDPFKGLGVGETATITFTYEVEDEDGETSTATATVTVTGTNDKAVVTVGNDSGTVTEASGVSNAIPGTPTATGNLHNTDADDSDDAWTPVTSATPSTGGFGTFTMTAAGVWVYTLNNAHGTVQGLNVGGTLTDSFTVTTADGTSEVVHITIKGADDKAVITAGNDTGSVTEAGGVANGSPGTQTATGNLHNTDVDNINDQWTAVGSATNSTNGYGTFTMTAAGAWTYTLKNGNGTVEALDTGDTLTDSFTVQTADGQSKVVNITIHGTDDKAVVAAGNDTGTVTEASGADNAITGTPTATGDLHNTDVDDANDAWTAVTSPTGSTNGYGTFTMTAAGVWIYTLDNTHASVQELNVGDTLTDSFIVQTADGTSEVVNITIKGADDKAVIAAGNDTGSVTEDLPATATGNLHSTDVDNADDAWTAVTTATTSANGYGTFVMTAAGAWTYTLSSAHAAVQALNAGDMLTDSFTVYTADGQSQVVSITINGANEAPPTVASIINAPAQLLYWSSDDEGGALTHINRISFQDVDSANATVQVTLSVTNPNDDLLASNGGNVTVFGSGTSTLVLTGTIADINAFIVGNNVSWNPQGDGNPSSKLTVSIDDNGATIGGNVASVEIDIKHEGESYKKNQGDDDVLVGKNIQDRDVDLAAGRDDDNRNDSVVTSWSHGPGGDDTNYDGGGDGESGDQDTITLVFQASQLESILNNEDDRDALDNLLDGGSEDLDFGSTSWNANVENFEDAKLALAAGHSGYVEYTPANSSTGVPDLDTTPDTGADLSLGNDFANTLRGGANANDTDNNGNDILVGLGGDDELWGGGGADLLLGGSGNDKLHGGNGNDVLSGGTGADTFFFSATGGSAEDFIVDYSYVDGDKIDLSALLSGVTADNINDRVNITQSGSDLLIQAKNSDSGSFNGNHDVVVLAGYGTDGQDPVKIHIDGVDYTITE